jgi:hypothetical protein
VRPRLELAIAVGALLVLATGVALLGSRRRPVENADPRRSTFVTSPDGARALAEALALLHVDVVRLRRRLDSAELRPRAVAGGSVLAFLAPAEPLTGFDARQLARRVRAGGDLLLAGRSAGVAMTCFGLHATWLRDSVAVAVPGVAGASPPWVDAALAPLPDSAAADSAGIRRAADCAVAVTRADTLLATPAGQAIALRLTAASGAVVTLVADGRLFSNRAMRQSAAGEFALGLFAGRYHQAIFDEYHQGFGPSGSLLGALLSWSVRSPWGWAGWQLAAVALLTLAAGAVRFGPARRAIERRRRSPLEHVRALANALAAARGHDVAITMQVQGLRRRLARGGAPVRGPTGPWLEGLEANLRTSRARAAAATLRSLTGSPQQAAAVLRAAEAVEDVWEELKP